MAIAGVHSVAVVDSTFLRDSPSQSPGRRGDGERGSSQPSSILQIWREIEDEHVVSQVQGGSGEALLQERSDGLVPDLSRENMADICRREGRMIGDTVLGENGSESCSQLQSQSESHDEHEELNNSTSENSSDLGEVERGRVRQIFREWMINGDRDHASNICRGNSGSRGEWLEEVEQDRVSVTRDLVQTSGQQSAVSSGDNKEERSSEIGTQVESVRDGFVVNHNEGQPVHTRRGIRKLCGRQVLLDMLKKAEMERQREVQELLDHRAVSHFPHRNRIQALLRGRFLRNDRSVDKIFSGIAESELGLLREKQTVSGLREGFFSRKDNSGCSQATSNLSDTSSVSDIDVNTIEKAGASSFYMVPTIHSEQSDADNRESDDRPGISGVQNCSLGIACENLDCQDSNANVETRELEISSSIGVTRSVSSERNIDIMPTEGTANDLVQQSLQIEDTGHSNMQELTGVHTEQSELVDINDNESNLSNDNIHAEGNIVEWRNSTEESVDGNHLSSTSNEWPQNILGDGENSRLQEVPEPEMWQEDGDFQEAVEIWLGAPSDHEVAQDGRVHGFYFPDDNNVYSVELRELLSRRSVSNLLHSSFRESLDQLIQSYVERQGHVQWELQEPISPSSTEQDLEQQSRNRITRSEDTVNNPLDLPLPPPPPPPPRPQWDRHSRHDNWSQNDINNHRLGIDWDIIGDMRIDMVRLQQRMNNMQRMMETCMDMQLELQRSIKQEVSAALNRSTSSSGIHDHDSQHGQSNWECVRKGVCCMCCESKIDSLLYRCGHMCTCSKCANDLVQSRRKCPMCHAPVVEVIRAYSI
ncbi:unnamed protein product [Lupinus luteus]|uniref:RING-type domain-containing protein n=1 Tax=Lupinus luteus TaxID=3873 RepID=A0AAV1YE50_LUPLU